MDVGRQESYWRQPFWPFVLDLIELLSMVAQERLSLSAVAFAADVAGVLCGAPWTAPSAGPAASSC